MALELMDGRELEEVIHNGAHFMDFSLINNIICNLMACERASWKHTLTK
jgi:hypothetical protein